MKKVLLYLKMLSLSLIIGALLSGSSALALNGGVGGRPGNPDANNPRSESIFIHTLSKNQQATDEVLVTNNTDTAQTIQLFATDAVVSSSGAFTCKQNADQKTDAGKWITLSASEVTLESGTNQKIPFTIAVPSNAQPGEHNACLAYQQKGEDGEIQGNVRIRSRSATRVAITVPGDLVKKVRINDLSVTNRAGVQSYLLSIKNLGTVSADIDTNVSLKSLFGEELYTNGGGYPILPRTDFEVRFENGDDAAEQKKLPFWGGWYIVKADVSYDKRSDQLDKPQGTSQITKDTKEKVIFIEPQGKALLIMGAIFLIIVGAIYYVARRRIIKKSALENWPDYTTKQGDSIESIALKHDIAWRKLAQINGIKPPYQLKKGAVIKVPAKTKKKLAR